MTTELLVVIIFGSLYLLWRYGTVYSYPPGHPTNNYNRNKYYVSTYDREMVIAAESPRFAALECLQRWGDDVGPQISVHQRSFGGPGAVVFDTWELRTEAYEEID